MRYDILIDPLPKEYEGYLIRTEYYYGLLILELFEDNELFTDSQSGEYQRISEAFRLLYGNGIPPFEVALAGLRWFMNGGEETQNEGSESTPVFSFSADAHRIYSAFRKNFGLDLQQTPVHWFEFLAMLGDMQDTAFSNAVDIRSMKPDDYKHYSAASKKKINEAKRRLRLEKAVHKAYTPEEQRKIDEFNKKMQGG